MPEKTTAQFLAQYQHELVEAGFDTGLAYEMVRHLAFRIHESEGVSVAKDKPKTIDVKIDGKMLATSAMQSSYDSAGWNGTHAVVAVKS